MPTATIALIDVCSRTFSRFETVRKCGVSTQRRAHNASRPASVPSWRRLCEASSPPRGEVQAHRRPMPRMRSHCRALTPGPQVAFSRSVPPRELRLDGASAHDQDAIAHPQHLRQVGRDHDDPGALIRRAGSSAGRCLTRARRRCRGWARRRGRCRRRAASHLASTTFCWLPPLSASAALLGPGVRIRRSAIACSASARSRRRLAPRRSATAPPGATARRCDRRRGRAPAPAPCDPRAGSRSVRPRPRPASGSGDGLAVDGDAPAVDRVGADDGARRARCVRRRPARRCRGSRRGAARRRCRAARRPPRPSTRRSSSPGVARRRG